MKPYKIVYFEPGAAHVIDRATDEIVGVVIADYFSRWEACNRLGGPIARVSSRDAAAALVWEHAR